MDSISNLHSVCAAKLVLSTYTGPLYQVERDSDGVTEDVYADATGWPSKTALASFADTGFGLSALLVPTCYDQTGNGRIFTQTTVANMPILNVDGAYPVFEGDGASMGWSAAPALSSFTNGVSSASVFMVRQLTNLNLKTQVLFTASNGASRNTPRMTFTYYGGKSTVGGTVTDSDTTLHRSTGLTTDAAWHVETGRWDFANGNMAHSLDATSEVVTGFEAGSVTSSTDSLAVTAGVAANSTGQIIGKFSLLATADGLSSDLDVDYATRLLPDLEVSGAPTNQFPVWDTTVPLFGPYTLAAGATNYLVQQPDGSTPALSDPLSLRYNHHTRIGVEPNSGRIFIAHSGAPVNETDTGMVSVVESTIDNWAHQVGPTIAAGPMSTFYPAGGADDLGFQIFPRGFQVYNGVLYLVSAILNPLQNVLVATPCNSDGSLGSTFAITNDPFTPFSSSFPAYAYNATLGPPLLAYTSVYGTWGSEGAQFVSIPLSTYTGNMRANGSFFTEPATVKLSNGKMLRFWRKFIGAVEHNVYLQISTNGGVTWGPMTRTNLPNEPSALDAIVLPNGHLAVIENPFDTAVYGRDPLYIATFDGTTGAPIAVAAVAQYIGDHPTYPGVAKDGGPTYSGVWESSLPNGVDTLYFSYSYWGKERIGMAAIPVAGL